MRSAKAAPARRLGIALAALCPGLAACSVLLDWDGYTGGVGGGVTDDGGEAGRGPRDAQGESDAGGSRCTAATCGGCCNAAGFCAGGQSTATCGTGGAACVDCSPGGKVCSAGACVAAPADAAPPGPCLPQACPVACAPIYQISCCKSDGTCGCQVELPTVGACM